MNPPQLVNGASARGVKAGRTKPCTLPDSIYTKRPEEANREGGLEAAWAEGGNRD